MFSRKMILSSAAVIAIAAATSAVAGGVDADMLIPKTDAGYYVGVDLGYAYANYKDSVQWRNNTHLEEGSGSHNITGGFAGDIHFGYQLNKNYAFELGWFYLPEVETNASNHGHVTVSAPLTLRNAPTAWMNSWVLYLAAKYMIPLCQKLKGDVFFKVGVAYRHEDIPKNASFAGNISTRVADYVRPMFAVGYERNLFDHLFINAQYTYFMGARNAFPLDIASNGQLGTVPANVFTLGMSYHFVL